MINLNSILANNFLKVSGQEPSSLFRIFRKFLWISKEARIFLRYHISAGRKLKQLIRHFFAANIQDYIKVLKLYILQYFNIILYINCKKRQISCLSLYIIIIIVYNYYIYLLTTSKLTKTHLPFKTDLLILSIYIIYIIYLQIYSYSSI